MGGQSHKEGKGPRQGREGKRERGHKEKGGKQLNRSTQLRSNIKDKKEVTAKTVKIQWGGGGKKKKQKLQIHTQSVIHYHAFLQEPGPRVERENKLKPRSKKREKAAEM